MIWLSERGRKAIEIMGWPKWKNENIGGPVHLYFDCHRSFSIRYFSKDGSVSGFSPLCNYQTACTLEHHATEWLGHNHIIRTEVGYLAVGDMLEHVPCIVCETRAEALIEAILAVDKENGA